MFCALLGQDISGERLQDHWSSGFIWSLNKGLTVVLKALLIT